MIRKSIIGVFFAFVLVAGTRAGAELRVDITRGTVEAMPIAITDFIGAGEEAARYGRDISAVISADLERSGLFKPTDPKAFIQTAQAVNVLPRFGDWRVINVQALVNGKIEVLGDGRLKVEFRLWDVFAEQQMIGRA